MGHLMAACPTTGFGLSLLHRLATSRAWLLSLIFSIIPNSSGFAKEIQGKPNVILILADDLGWADLGCYGSKYHKTPNLDRLAADGVRFTQAYAAAPVCSPTRAAIMTGKYPARLGITDWLPGRPDRPDQKLSRPKLVTDLPGDLPSLADPVQDKPATRRG